jgi:hypothetical protein
MSGWLADGLTLRTWRTCPHPDVLAGRCVSCRARPVQYTAPRGRIPKAVSLTSSYVTLPKISYLPIARVAEFPGTFMPNNRKEWE